jgi:glutathione S-transferase
MSDLILTTYDWVPETPRGHVRDLRVRWALEEASLPYRVESTPFRERGPEHLAHQPFGQIPWLKDGDLSIFESGAILLHLGEKSEALMPTDARGRAEVVEWVFAALNSIEMASVPWSIFHFTGQTGDSPGFKFFDDWVKARMARLEPVLASREWLAGRFSVADIVMVDALRLIDRFDGLAGCAACREYVARGMARPAFVKAHADQLAHFAAGDRGA